MKKVLNMADVKDVKKANTKMAFRTGVENVVNLMAELQKRGVRLQEPQDTVLR